MLIESALWNEINIAQTGRKLGINSDARYRFERGVDPAFMVPGLELATRHGDGTVRRHAVGERRGRQIPRRRPHRSIFRSPRSKRLAGIDVPLAEMRRILDRLGFMRAPAAARW